MASRPWEKYQKTSEGKPWEKYRILGLPETTTVMPSSTSIRPPEIPTEPQLQTQEYQVPIALGGGEFLPPGQYQVPETKPEAEVLPGESRIKESLRKIPPGLKGIASGTLFILQPQEILNMAKGLGEMGGLVVADLVEGSSPTLAKIIRGSMKPEAQIPALRLPEDYTESGADKAVNAVMEQLTFFALPTAIGRGLRNIRVTKEWQSAYDYAKGRGISDEMADQVAKAKVTGSIIKRGKVSGKEQQVIDDVKSNIQRTYKVDEATAEQFLQHYGQQYGDLSVDDIISKIGGRGITKWKEPPDVSWDLSAQPVTPPKPPPTPGLPQGGFIATPEGITKQYVSPEVRPTRLTPEQIAKYRAKLEKLTSFKPEEVSGIKVIRGEYPEGARTTPTPQKPTTSMATRYTEATKKHEGEDIETFRPNVASEFTAKDVPELNKLYESTDKIAKDFEAMVQSRRQRNVKVPDDMLEEWAYWNQETQGIRDTIDQLTGRQKAGKIVEKDLSAPRKTKGPTGTFQQYIIAKRGLSKKTLQDVGISHKDEKALYMRLARENGRGLDDMLKTFNEEFGTNLSESQFVDLIRKNENVDKWLNPEVEAKPKDQPTEAELAGAPSTKKEEKMPSSVKITGEKETVDLDEIGEGDQFTINGEKFKVVKEEDIDGVRFVEIEDGNRFVLDEAFEQKIDIDKGSYKGAGTEEKLPPRVEKPKAELTPEEEYRDLKDKFMSYKVGLGSPEAKRLAELEKIVKPVGEEPLPSKSELRQRAEEAEVKPKPTVKKTPEQEYTEQLGKQGIKAKTGLTKDQQREEMRRRVESGEMAGDIFLETEKKKQTNLLDIEKEKPEIKEEVKPSEKEITKEEQPPTALYKRPGVGRKLGRLPSAQPYEEVKVARTDFSRSPKSDQINKSISGVLKPHQRDGVNLAVESIEDFGGFLMADGTGAGKTMQELAVAHTMLEKYGKPVLIITENDRIINDSFKKDAKRLGIEVKRLERGQKLDKNIYLATYHDITHGKIPQQITREISTIIFDESQNLKNMESSKKAQRGFQLAESTEHVMFASATPLDKPNHIRYMKKMGLYKTEKEFEDIIHSMGVEKRTKRIPTERGIKEIEYYARMKDVSPVEMGQLMNQYFEDLTDQGLMLKREVSLENLDCNLITIEIPEEGLADLSAIDASYKGRMSGIPQADALLKAQNLMAQRRALEYYKAPSTMEILKKEVKAGKQVVVFATRINATEVVEKKKVYTPQGVDIIETTISETEGTIKELEKALIAEYGPNSFSKVYGSNKEAQKEIDKFQKGTTKILVATPQSGGTGINLDDITGDKPRTLIMITPPFSAMDFLQALGRIVRLTTKSRAKAYALFTNTPVDEWNKAIISYKVKAVGGSVSGEVKKLDIDTLKNISGLGEYESIEAIANIPERKTGFIDAALRDLKGEQAGLLYDPFRNIRVWLQARVRGTTQAINRQVQPGADPTIWEKTKMMAQEYLGTKMEQYIAWTGSVERGKTIYHLERNERVNNNILRKAIAEDTKKRFQNIPKEVRAKIFKALQGVRGFDENYRPIFGAIQRAGIIKPKELDQMQLDVGDELPDGRVIGNLIDVKGRPYHQLYRLIKEDVAEVLWNEAAASHTEAVNLIKQYLLPYEFPMVTDRGLRVPPFSAQRLRELYDIKETLSKGAEFTEDQLRKLEARGYDREIFIGPIPYVPSIPKDPKIFPATRKLVRTFVKAFSKKYAPGRRYQTGTMREEGEELEDIAKATQKRRMEFAAEDTHNRIVAMMISSALEPYGAGNPLKTGYIPFNLGYFKDAETQQRFIGIVNQLRDLFIGNGINPNDLIFTAIQAGGGLPKYQIHRKLVDALAGTFKDKEEGLYQALYEFFNAGIRAITGNWLMRPSTLNRNFISNKVFQGVKFIEDFYRGMYLMISDSDYPLPLANVMFDILAQVPTVINPYKMRLSPKRAITNEMLGQATFGDWEEEEALSLRKYWFHLWNKMELMDKRLVKWSEMYAQAVREYVRLRSGQQPTWPDLPPEVAQLARQGDKKNFIDAFILHIPEAAEWASYEVMDRFELDYSNIPIWLSTFLKTPLGKGTTPYVRFFYKFGRQFADISNYPGNLVKWYKAKQRGDKPEAAKYMAKILTGITLSIGLWNYLDNENELEGKGVPYYTDTFGRVEVAPSVWVRLYDIPYIGETMFMRSMWYKGKAGMDYFTDRFSLGPVFGMASMITGRGTKYDLIYEGNEFKPFGARLGAEIAGWLPPVVQFTRKWVDQQKRIDYDEYKGFLANLWIGLAENLPEASKLLEPKKTTGGKIVEYDVPEEIAKFFLLNIKNPDVEDYERAIRFVINQMREADLKAKTGRRNPEDILKRLEEYRTLLESLSKAKDKLETKMD